MWLITLCLISGYPCQDQIRYGLFDTREECIEKIRGREVERRIEKYKGKVFAKCQEIWVSKLTQEK